MNDKLKGLLIVAYLKGGERLPISRKTTLKKLPAEAAARDWYCVYTYDQKPILNSVKHAKALDVEFSYAYNAELDVLWVKTE
jgi:hypothetical protein